MKVLEVLGRSAGGIARHVATVQRGLHGRDGLEISIAGPSGLPEAMPEPFHEVNIPDGPFGHRRAVKSLTEIARGSDVCHGHGLRAGIDSALAARKIGASAFVTVHNLVRPEIAGRIKAPMYAYAEKIVVRLNDRVFCVSEEIAEHLRSRVPPADRAKIEVTYLGVDRPPERRRSRDEIREEVDIGPRPMIVTVSRLSPQKALDVMFEAVAMLDEAVLVILGDGPLRGGLEASARVLLRDRVRFLGYRNNAIDYVAAADVFCLSSIWEGVPLSAMEAILAGVPVVSTDVGGMPEIVTDRVSGRLVPANDPASLAGALRDVLTDPGRARAYAAAAMDHVAHRFSIDQMIAHLSTAYRGAGA